MPSLRAIATVLAAALMALGLSVGAAMAEGPREPAKAHYTPKGVCLLKDGTKK
jgi:hypothetical protein